ncbi:MAG: CDP-glucose 4,6-dehydratase [Rickettsiales bacterium]|jgi:CDP-glucose 4,6-dehydratase
MKLDQSFWKGKKVFITGHTGFKGSWLTLWLEQLGCKICGYSLEPNTEPNLFSILQLENKIEHRIGDIRNYEDLSAAINQFEPDIIFHLAAQALVRYSYHNPLETYQTNVMGTANLLEAVRHYGKAKATIVITTDKCYENKEQIWGYREHDPMGGHDPYSNSKGCAELVVSSYANSYFITNPQIGKIASARAGNVIGGGDWSQDRLVPDLIKKLSQDQNPIIRNPKAIRPWQHVLEPLFGYILSIQYMCGLEKQVTLLNWNFGPDLDDQQDVGFVAEKICQNWGGKNKVQLDIEPNQLHEANLLYLDCTKARKELGWIPKLDIDQTIKKTCDWYKNYSLSNSNTLKLTINQINRYQNDQ